MADPPPQSGPVWKDWIPALSFAVVLAGALIAGGGYISQLRDNTRRLDALEQRVELLRSIDTRTARIEAKLEVLVPEKEHRP
ncbi:hypothetical protein [Sphingomonas sanguinis]|uniref:Uncharacterized protein n=1 Tax=Sphingomonas sanguinis TaxID=33051 RepID=A0A147IXA5_9SPHN|nr:hypothetical protein [Sphingomonas sanguinis]KTW00456.1 hypothetical protein SB4_07035 [Sphingomonas sanguinis]